MACAAILPFVLHNCVPCPLLHAQALLATCQQLRTQLQDAIPHSTWKQIVEASVPRGHPLRSAPPGSMPQAAAQLAQVQANIGSGRSAWLRQFAWEQGQNWVKVVAKPSNARDHMITIREGGFHLYRLTIGTTAPERLPVELVWKMAVPECAKMDLENSCCEMT